MSLDTWGVGLPLKWNSFSFVIPAEHNSLAKTTPKCLWCSRSQSLMVLSMPKHKLAHVQHTFCSPLLILALKSISKACNSAVVLRQYWSWKYCRKSYKQADRSSSKIIPQTPNVLTNMNRVEIHANSLPSLVLYTFNVLLPVSTKLADLLMNN